MEEFKPISKEKQIELATKAVKLLIERTQKGWSVWRKTGDNNCKYYYELLLLNSAFGACYLSYRGENLSCPPELSKQLGKETITQFARHRELQVREAFDTLETHVNYNTK